METTKKIPLIFEGDCTGDGRAINVLYDGYRGDRVIYAEILLPDPDCDPEDPEFADDYKDLPGWEREMLGRFYRFNHDDYNDALTEYDEFYGYLSLKRAILKELPADIAARIKWPYGDDDECFDNCPQASAGNPYLDVTVEIDLDNLPENQ